MLREGQDTVVLRLLWRSRGLADLLLDAVEWLEEVDFAI